MNLTRYLILFTLVGMTVGIASADNPYATDPSYQEVDSVEITDNWSDYIDISQSHLSVTDGTLKYTTSGEEISEDILTTDGDIVYASTDISSVNTASSSTGLAITEGGSVVEDTTFSTGLNEITYNNEGESRGVELFSTPLTGGTPSEPKPFYMENVEDNVEPNSTASVNAEPENYNVYIQENGGSEVSVGSTGWNISTAEDTGKTTGTKDTGPEGIHLSPDGTTMYALGFSDEATDQYSLSTPWDISTATHEKRVDNYDGNSADLFINPNGTKLYELEKADGAIHQFSIEDGDIGTKSPREEFISTQSSSPEDIHFSPDGTKMYEIGSDTIYEWDLSTAWDISTATYNDVNVATSGGSTGLFFHPDGKKMYAINGDGDDKIHQYSLTTAWDLSTATDDAITSPDISPGDPHGLFFDSRGTNLYFVSRGGEEVYQYSLDLTSSETINYTVPNSSVDQYTIRVESDGSSLEFERYYYPETGNFVSSFMTYEVDSVEAASYNKVRLDNYIPGQVADFNLSVSHTGHPDQNYDDGKMEEYYSKSLVYKGTTESGGESIQESDWQQIDFSGENGTTQTEINSEEEFSVQRYDSGDYTAVLALAKVNGTYDFGSSSWNLTETEVDRDTYSWTVTQADSPTNPLTDLQNFLMSFIESIINSIDSIFSEGSIGTPSVETPPSGP